MSSSDEAYALNGPERSGLVRRVVEDCLQRRSSGERLPDESVIAYHQELMPELGAELRKLALLEHARQRAVGVDSRSDTPVPELPAGFEGCAVVREIHRGGQAVVYQGIQTSTKRKVAIKVLHGGPFADARSRARLEREIQILGQLNHPNIVRVYDSGTAAGCLYYVMDYISGEALDVYLLNNPLSVDDTLRLFAKICDAVNAAHLRGVIHRDLKPSNIRIDANGEPHVLDFGLAKVALEPGSDATRPLLVSLTGQFIGSLPWASPEQAAGQPEKIDVRTDVYSLGVILYQMLTGKFPYEVVGGMHDVLDNILKAEPIRPRGLRLEIDDEVETILLKCLDKQRDQRYQSAGEVARDIRHYLGGEPIEAKRDSALYMLTKTLRRYRAPLAVGATFVLLLAGFAATMTLMYQRAEHEGHKAEQAADFLDRVLASADPDLAGGPDLTVREMLDDALREADWRTVEPEVEARIRDTAGRTYVRLGEYAIAAEHLGIALEIRRRILGNRHAATAESLSTLAWAQKEHGEYAEARCLYDEALRIRRDVLGVEHLAVAETLNGLGQLLFAQREYEQAEPFLRDALAMRQRLLGAEHQDVASSMANLGSLLRDWRRDADQLDEAEELLREALALRRQLFGDLHTHTIVSLNKLGLLLGVKGQPTAAREVFEEALRLRRELLGPEHPLVAVSRNNLGLALYKEGSYEEAGSCFERALALCRQTMGPEDSRVTDITINAAACLAKLTRYAEAEELLLTRHADLEHALGSDDAQTVATWRALETLRAWERPSEEVRHRARPSSTDDQADRQTP